MPVYTNSEGQKFYWGKGMAIGGIIAGVGLAAVGTGVFGSCLADLIDKHREGYISMKEAQGLFIYSALGIYGLYEGLSALPRKWNELQRIRCFEQFKGKKIEGNDYSEGHK